MDAQEFVERRVQNGISVKLDILHDDVKDMKAVLRELTAAISRLAVVESDLSHHSAAQERAFLVLAELEKRVANYESSTNARLAKNDIAIANASRTSGWVDKAVVAVVALVASYIAAKVGLK